MRAKLLILFLGLLGLFVAVTAFRVDQLLVDDKLAWNEAQSRAQMGALSEAVRADLNSARDTLELAWPQLAPLKKDYPKGHPYSKFQMMGTLTKSGGDWNFDDKLYIEGSSVRSWAASYAVLALKGLKDSQIPVNGSAVLALLDPSRKVYFLVVTRTPSRWIAGVTGPEIFQRAMDRQKGQVSSVFAVNAIGQALAHTVPEYVGSLLGDDPVVKDLLHSEAGAGSGVFSGPHGQVQGFYEQLPQSNVFVVVSTPVDELMASRKDVRWQVLLLGIGFGMIGVAVLLMLTRNLSIAGSSVAAPILGGKASKPSVEAGAAGVIRMQAYTRVAASLAHELKGPMLSLLGRTRLLRESATDPEMQQSLSKIEDRAREAYGTLHKLLTFAGEKEEAPAPTLLDDLLRRTLKMLAPRIQERGIRLETKFQNVPPIQAPPALLVKAFEQVILNSMESMDRSLKKNMSIELEAVPEGARIVVQDSGDGIQAKDLEHIFDPFFTTRAGSGHSGLGLSLALGIVRESGGKMRAESALGQGTRMEILFPKEVSESEVGAAAESAVASDASDLPRTPRSTPSTPNLQTPEKPADLPEVLNDRLMERAFDMIDHLDEVGGPFKAPPQAPPAPAKASAGEQPSDDERTAILDGDSAAQPPPPPSGPASSGGHEDFMNFTAKIDKPKAPPPKKKNRLLDLGTEVRRPGGDRT